MTYLFKDLYKSFIIRSPIKVGSLLFRVQALGLQGFTLRGAFALGFGNLQFQISHSVGFGSSRLQVRRDVAR